MKTLRFFPHYEPYLISATKTTTLRMGNSAHLQAGDEALITVGWESEDQRPLHRAVITSVERKPLGQLTEQDLAGESPDCRSPEAARLVLSGIYRTLIPPSRPVYIVKFRHGR